MVKLLLLLAEVRTNSFYISFHLISFPWHVKTCCFFLCFTIGPFLEWASSFPAISCFLAIWFALAVLFSFDCWSHINYRCQSKMAKSGERSDSLIKKKFDDVCRELNMDETTAVSAWETFERINRNYSLEVRKNSLEQSVINSRQNSYDVIRSSGDLQLFQIHERSFGIFGL